MIRSMILQAGAGVLGIALGAAAIVTVLIALRVESRHTRRPPAGEAATDVGADQ